MGRGLSDAEIAKSLGISQRAVRFHLRHILDKLGVATRAKAIIRALFDLRDYKLISQRFFSCPGIPRHNLPKLVGEPARNDSIQQVSGVVV